MKRVANFEKVSFEQFKKDCEANNLTFDSEEKFREIYEAIELPHRGTKFSAGYDFMSPLTRTLCAGDSIVVPTGIRCGINNDWVLMLYPRSGLGFKYHVGLANTVGVIDSDYYDSDNEGHIMVKLVNNGTKNLLINKGDKIVQGVFVQYGITWDDNVETSRNGGFGSTGR